MTIQTATVDIRAMRELDLPAEPSQANTSRTNTVSTLIKTSADC